MREAMANLVTERLAWLHMPELEALLPKAAESFKTDVLGNIPMEDILAGKYEWPGPDDQEDGDPDEGIIAKYPGKNDPSRKRHGVPPDSKVYLQYRLRTKRVFQERGQYQPVFDPFFNVMKQVRSRLDFRIEDMLDQLWQQRPKLGRLHHNRERSVIRVMTYLDAREDGSGLAGKCHTDRNDITLHLYDSVPGLVLQHEVGKFELVPTRPGYALAFVGDRLASLARLPAVLHGARHNGQRQVLVMFVHLIHEDGS